MSIEALREKLEFAEKNPAIFDQRNVLDKGFVRMVDWMGDDSRVVQAARVSYGKGTKSIREDAGLIDYLMRHRHTSPFEMVDFVFHIKLPLFVFAQLVRHRTASLNAMSARYSVMKDEFYLPEEFRAQDVVNKQGSSGGISESLNQTARTITRSSSNTAYADYEHLINSGVVREQARMILPQNLYTEVYWKQNLHNLLHLLKLRLDAHAQQEIRDYAEAIHEIIAPIVPSSLSSWEHHVLNGVTITKAEIQVLGAMVAGSSMDEALSNVPNMSPGYAREVKDKLKKIIGV